MVAKNGGAPERTQKGKVRSQFESQHMTWISSQRQPELDVRSMCEYACFAGDTIDRSWAPNELGCKGRDA